MNSTLELFLNLALSRAKKNLPIWLQGGAIFEMTDNYPKIVNNFSYMEVPSRLERQKDAGIWDFIRAMFRLINRRCLVLTDLFDDKNRDWH